MSMHVPNKYRIRSGQFATNDDVGNNGMFFIPLEHSQFLQVIASDEIGWEHVSVSRRDRCPTWSEMCFIKSMFWDEEDCVVQFHPPKSQYVNHHPYCLHMWRKVGEEFQTHPSWMVGPTG
jgi:hypothetical protein